MTALPLASPPPGLALPLIMQWLETRTRPASPPQRLRATMPSGRHRAQEPTHRDWRLVVGIAAAAAVLVVIVVVVLLVQ